MTHQNDKSINSLGIQKRRWPRTDDGIKANEPSYSFGSLAEFDYKNKQLMFEKSPGPVYKPSTNKLLEQSASYTMISTASRDYDEKYRNKCRSPGPVYKPKHRHTSKNTNILGYMGSLASREYDQKKTLNSKSPGPVYNIKKGTTSNRPPPKACTLKTRHTNQDDKASKEIPGPNAYFPDTKYTKKNASGGYIGTLASRNYHHTKIQSSKSPGPVFLPKTTGTSTMAPAKSYSFGSKVRYSDEIEKSKYMAGPGSYCPEIIPRFKRTKSKKRK